MAGRIDVVGCFLVVLCVLACNGQDVNVTPPPVFPLVLGNITFPTSTNSALAQQQFETGVLLMLNFWYDLAITYFQKAQQTDPTFAMAYWGEALSNSEQLWSVENVTLSASIMQMITPDMPTSAKEQMYIFAANEMYNLTLINDQQQRLQNYMAAMQTLASSKVADETAKTLQALSVISYYFWGYETFETWNSTYFLPTLRTLNAVANKNQFNPGAWHYIIHACDDPYNYPLALDAANIYPLVAPSSSHAQHMPSHIFIRFGWWPQTMIRNLFSWAVQMEYDDLCNGTAEDYQWHANTFLQYAYVELGQFAASLATVQLMSQYLGSFNSMNPLEQSDYATMVATYILNTEDWSACNLVPPLMTCSDCWDPAAETDDFQYAVSGNSQTLLTMGMCALNSPNSEVTTIDDVLALVANQTMLANASNPQPYWVQALQVTYAQLSGMQLWTVYGDSASAIDCFSSAMELEDDMGPPSEGPPFPTLPSRDLLASVYYANGDAESALGLYLNSLDLIPNRFTALLGAARSYAKLGDVSNAICYYEDVLINWDNADAGIPGLQEAQDYLRGHAYSSGSPPPAHHKTHPAVIAIIVLVSLAAVAVIAYVVVKRMRSSRNGYASVELDGAERERKPSSKQVVYGGY